MTRESAEAPLRPSEHHVLKWDAEDLQGMQGCFLVLCMGNGMCNVHNASTLRFGFSGRWHRLVRCLDRPMDKWWLILKPARLSLEFFFEPRSIPKLIKPETEQEKVPCGNLVRVCSQPRLTKCTMDLGRDAR